jgi:hypothetical protein
MSPEMGKTPHKRGLSTETHDRGGSLLGFFRPDYGGMSGAIC